MEETLKDYLETLLFTTMEDDFPEYCYSGEFRASKQDLARFRNKDLIRSETELDIFQKQARSIVGYNLGPSWPREFAYSRNGHGTGFFDSDDDYTEDQRKKLQDLARSFGEVHLFKLASSKSTKCKIGIA